jgi:hypothetical protein
MLLGDEKLSQREIDLDERIKKLYEELAAKKRKQAEEEERIRKKEEELKRLMAELERD